MIIHEEKSKRALKKFIIILFWLVFWEILSIIINSPLLFAGPLETILRLIDEVVKVKFWFSLGASIMRIMAGFFLGIFVGSILGLLSYRKNFLKELMAPLMHFSKAVPVASFVVMILIWWGSDFLSTASCFLVVLPIGYVNFLEGLQHTDKKLLEMAEVFHMPLKNKVFYIYRPALLPFMEGCLKTALGMGIKSGIAAEVIGMTNFSIGGEMYLSKIYLDTAGVFSWTAVVILISVILEKIILMSLISFCRWNPKVMKSKAEKVLYDGMRYDGTRYDGTRYDGMRYDGTRYDGIRLEGITKNYQNQKVLSDITQNFEAGEKICIMGPSGYGKTTLLHIIAGIVKPDSGQVLRWREGKATDKMRIHPGMVFQEDRLCEEQNAITNVKLVSSDWDKALDCLKELLPSEALELPVLKLSGGMRRRVCIARALAANTNYLIFDEPFSGLDDETRRKAIDVILKYRDDRLLLMATHEEKDADMLSGKLWRLDGK